MKLLIATKNPGKFAEISEVLGQVKNLELVSLRDLGIEDEVEETGRTHEENAVIKAKYFSEKTGLPTLGEDSGIYVDAFPGELGVATRRWENLHHASDEEWISYFLKKMERAPPRERTAKFVCCAAIVLSPNAEPVIFTGQTWGYITQTLEAPIKAGIPISSCFRPDREDKVYAALSAEEKNRISHRGKAMRAVKKYLLQAKN